MTATRKHQQRTLKRGSETTLQRKEYVMKKLNLSLTTLALCLAATPAFAASTKVYNSGILVLVFIGFCALVVVAQMIPAIITLFGIIKGAVTARKQETAEAKAVE
jgi:hypothetical protein